jgi:AraC-like DNA-binding protein
MLQRIQLPGTPHFASPDENASQRVGNFATLPGLLLRLGVDPAAVMQDAGLAPDALAHAENRVSYAGLGRVLRHATDRTGCAHLGLLAGRMWHLCDLGLVGELMRNSETVGEALQTLTAHQHLNSEGGLAFFIDRGPVVDLGYAIYEQRFEGRDVMYDALLAGSVNFLRELCGPGWTPSEVLLPHAKPVEVSPYGNLFKVHPRFNSEICALRFPAHWMKHPVDGADPKRLRIAKEQVELISSPALLQQVRRAIRLLLLHERHSGDDVAQMLAMHRRTLNRRLKAEGTTFQEVLDSVRYSVACELLSVPEISLDDVAATLGYAGVSPFMRTFHRWAGTTPGRWRREAELR